MNKYLCPLADLQAGEVWNQVISATSLNDCKDKLTDFITNEYDLNPTDDWTDFVEECNANDILIGQIEDIETL